MNYEMMIPDFERVDFEKMTKMQAKEYFEWYTSQIDYRLSLLLNVIKLDGINVSFDFSPNSLIPLWEWYENKISVRKITKEEYNDRLKQYEDWMKIYVSDTELSYETLMICLDMSFYFAEVIIRNNNTINWSFFTKPKNRDSVNQPVLLGFKNDIDLNPRTVLFNCTLRSLKDKNNKRLYDMYFTWKKYI